MRSRPPRLSSGTGADTSGLAASAFCEACAVAATDWPTSRPLCRWARWLLSGVEFAACTNSLTGFAVCGRSGASGPCGRLDARSGVSACARVAVLRSLPGRSWMMPAPLPRRSRTVGTGRRRPRSRPVRRTVLRAARSELAARADRRFVDWRLVDRLGRLRRLRRRRLDRPRWRLSGAAGATGATVPVAGVSAPASAGASAATGAWASGSAAAVCWRRYRRLAASAASGVAASSVVAGSASAAGFVAVSTVGALPPRRRPQRLGRAFGLPGRGRRIRRRLGSVITLIRALRALGVGARCVAALGGVLFCARQDW